MNAPSANTLLNAILPTHGVPSITPMGRGGLLLQYRLYSSVRSGSERWLRCNLLEEGELDKAAILSAPGKSAVTVTLE